MTLKSQIVCPADLSSEDEARWRALARGHRDFSSPLLGPDFARAVGEVRQDAQVAIWRRDGEAVGFLPHHRRPHRVARPIGAPLSDYHALVSDAFLPASSALELAGLSAYRFSGLIDPFGSFNAHIAGRQDAFVVSLESDSAAYLEALRAHSAKRFKNYRRLHHKIEREIGPITVAAPDRDAAALQQLVDWKRDQLQRTGLHDFLAPSWTQQLLRNLFRQQQGAFQGLMIGLRVDGRLIAGHFGVRLGEHYHPWIASTDPEMAAWSPGQLFLIHAIATMSDLGLRTYDLGPGHTHYKAPYALSRRSIADGAALTKGLTSLRARLGESAWRLAAAGGGGVVPRLRRRLDVITDAELSFEGRVRGLTVAVSSRTSSAARPDDDA